MSLSKITEDIAENIIAGLTISDGQIVDITSDEIKYLIDNGYMLRSLRKGTENIICIFKQVISKNNVCDFGEYVRIEDAINILKNANFKIELKEKTEKCDGIFYHLSSFFYLY